MENLGMVGIVSVSGKYMQAHTDGEMHSSNPHRNEEETWYLFEIDKTAHTYALANWRTGKFLCKNGRNQVCCIADRGAVAEWETWTLISGVPFGCPDKVALRAFDGTYMGGNQDDTECGGEISCGDAATPPHGNGGWPGWWRFEGADTPTSGSNVWNTVGGFLAGVGNKVAPVVISVLIEELAAAVVVV